MPPTDPSPEPFDATALHDGKAHALSEELSGRKPPELEKRCSAIDKIPRLYFAKGVL